MATWVEEYPGRLENEIALLEDKGATIAIDQEAKQRDVIILNVSWPSSIGEVDLIIKFPDFYPFIRPEVFAPALHLQKHFSPTQQNFCLLDRATVNWRPQNQIANVIEERLDLIFHMNGLADEPVSKLKEAPHAEPMEVWWNWFARPGSFILIDSEFEMPECQAGTLELLYSIQGSRDDFKLRAMVYRVLDDCNRPIYTWPQAIPLEFNKNRQIKACWQKSGEVIVPPIASQYGEDLKEHFASLPASPNQMRDLKLTLDLRCILYPTEITKGREGVGWLMIAGHKKLAKRRNHYCLDNIRTERAGPSDHRERIKHLEGLMDKKVVLVGAGNLGSHIGVELAKCQIPELHIVDHDRVEAGNIVRWAGGFPQVGELKANALADMIEANYPATTAKATPMRTGRIREDHSDTVNEREQWREILVDADLIIDATAEEGVNFIMNELSLKHGVPLLTVAATPTLEGGTISLVNINRESACFFCLKTHQWTNETVDIPIGYDDEALDSEIAGCGERTFTGANFQTGPLVAEATNLAASFLSGNMQAPEVSVALTLSKSVKAGLSLPGWTAQNFVKAEACDCCL